MKSPQYSEIRCSSTPLYRYEELEGRRHLVIPVVMLVGNTVIQAANAPTPELVTLECLQKSFLQSFDGRPIVPYHPRKGKRFVSANSPEVFTEARLGTIFSTLLNGSNLGCEGWLDIERANEIGGDAQLAIDRIESGETIDISVGVYHDSIVVSGKTVDGQEYGAIWTEIYGDHLALLPASEGACGQDIGCGAPRVAELAQVNIEEEISPMQDNKQESTSFISRLLAKFRASVIFNDGDSDEDLHKMLAKAMRSIDPSFDWICYVYREVSSFIYATYIILGGSYQGQMKWWRRTFTLSADGKSVTINNDAVEVRLKEMWETVNDGEEVEEVAAAQSTQPAKIKANCSCQDQPKASEEIKMEKKDEEKSPAVAETPVIAPVPVPAAPAVPVQPASLTVQQAIASCPELQPLIAAAERFQALENARKADLVTRLSTAQKVYDLAALQSKPVDELEKIAALISIDAPKVDYSARGLNQSPTVASAPVVKELPDPWGLKAKGIDLN